MYNSLPTHLSTVLVPLFLLYLQNAVAFHPTPSIQSIHHVIQTIPTNTPNPTQLTQLTQLNALSSRRECLERLEQSTVRIAATAGLLLSQPTHAALAVSAALAVDPNSGNSGDSGVSLDYQGVYTDPKHPKGYRVLIGDGNSATLELQDDPLGEIYNLPVEVQSEPIPTDAKSYNIQQLSFDFSPKGGPSNIKATVARDREGIPILKFPDGNQWKKRETGIVGVYQDGFEPDQIRVIRQSKGRELTVDLLDIKSMEVSKASKTTKTTIRAMAGNPTILFDFPGTVGVPGVADMKRKTITFDDGNVWTKF